MDDLLFVHGLILIMKVKVYKRWRTSRIKNDLMSNLENCYRDEFKDSTRDLYVGRSLMKEMKETNDDTNESRQEHRTRVLNDKWV